MSKPNLLFVAPHYFNYDRVIKNYLETKGFVVDFVNDRPYDSNIFKAIIRINRSIINQFLYYFYKREVLKKSSQDYELIFVIQGEGLVPKFLQWLRIKYRGTPMVCYLWDSIKNKPKLQENFAYFDRIFSFDYKDAKKFDLDFVPLFFSPNIADAKNEKVLYDLSFVGTVHDDRALIVKSIKKNLSHLKLFVYLYSPSRWIFYIRHFFNLDFLKLDFNHINFEKLSYDEVQKIRLQSKVILDIHHRNQSGLTIRTIETIALGKKIATTNGDIKHYDFYDPHNIFILNRKDLRIPTSFFKSSYRPLSKNIIERYSLESFYQSIIGPYLDKKDHVSKN
jgi:hypothetical protein